MRAAKLPPIPDHLMIAGVRVPVIVTTPKELRRAGERKAARKLDPLYGFYDPMKVRIVLNREKVSAERLRQTLHHEAAHAHFDLSGAKEIVAGAVKRRHRKRVEEILVRVWATPLACLAADLGGAK